MTVRGISPSDIARYDVISSRSQDPTLTFTRDSPFHGDYPVCGDLWFETSGQRVLTACGVLLRTTDDATTDMTYAGELSATAERLTIPHADQLGSRWAALLPADPFTVPDQDYVSFYDTPSGNDLHREHTSSLLAGSVSL